MMLFDQILLRLNRVDEDKYIQNMIAQANARYILLNTSSNISSFPNYTIKDSNLNILAFYYLHNGCQLAENQSFQFSREPLEKGASILEYIHGSSLNKSGLSNYYSLVSALAYYVCFQYSKSFILIKKTEVNTVIGRLLYLFLERDFIRLSIEIETLIVNETYTDDYISQHARDLDEDLTSAKIYEIVIAKSINGFIKYFQTGVEHFLDMAKGSLRNLKIIAELNNDPSIWWIIRLLLLISEGFDQAALWKSLSPYFEINSLNVRSYIFSLIYQQPRGIYELFITQRRSLEKVLNNNAGCIISIPTSSGKTRIAEIAILESVIKWPEKKVLYIAPFRSLAFEIENSLEKILTHANVSVSHIYGGSLYSKIDEKIIEESNVIIATPEKSKAIFRGNVELLDQLSLVIIDEGHLLGPNQRLITNEIFFEELRFFVEKNSGRFLLLSAVLPNTGELAQWLTNSEDTVYKDKWRPSDERMGILEWKGEGVNLNWENSVSEISSYNTNFIVTEQLPLELRQRVPRHFPSDKNEAVAATAYKLRSLGPVLIFVGVKTSVFKMATAYMKCLGNAPEDFRWKNSHDWRAFELACVESYGPNSNWLLFAKKGILCHNSDLHVDVRLPMERLMRVDKPLVIIATSTLGQGVNLGVSTVIFSTLYQSGELISARDFWNISGRAGRAFVDHEGKVLVALDLTNNLEIGTTAYKKRNKEIKWQKQTIKEYFDKDQIDLATSGILLLVKALKKIGEKNNISFDLLLSLIAENKLEEIGDDSKRIDNSLDWIDDTLLSLHQINNDNDEEQISYSWIEDFFRRSLAYIQAGKERNVSGEEILSFVECRVKGIVAKVGTNQDKWKSIIKSGIPLNSDLFVEDKLQQIIQLLIGYDFSEKLIDDKILLLKDLEYLLEKIPVFLEDGSDIQSKDIDLIRKAWLHGEAMSSISRFDNGILIVTKLYSYKLPWILNGIAKKLRAIELFDEADVVEEISMLVESGLPNLVTIKIYQAGIRSRVASTEIASLFDNELQDRSIREYKKDLIIHKETYKEMVSSITAEWIDLLSRMSVWKEFLIDTIPDFEYRKPLPNITTLIAREINGEQYLLSLDLSFYEKIPEGEIDFTSVNNVPGVYFEFDAVEEVWKMRVDNPYVELREE